jgi:hypothetical protein
MLLYSEHTGRARACPLFRVAKEFDHFSGHFLDRADGDESTVFTNLVTNISHIEADHWASQNHGFEDHKWKGVGSGGEEEDIERT